MAAERPDLALSILEKLADDNGSLWADHGNGSFSIDAYATGLTSEERDLLDTLRNEADLRS